MSYKDTEKMTVDAMQRYYMGDPSLLFEYAHPEIIVLSIGKGQLIKGKEDMIEYLSNDTKGEIQYELTGITCNAYPTGGSNQNCMTVLQLDVTAYYPSGRVTRANQRVTVDWKYFRKPEDKWMAMSLHISVASEQKNETNVVAQINENYLYETTELIQEERKYMFKDVLGNSHYTSEMQIVRVQSDIAYSKIFLRDGGMFRVNKMITELEKELGSNFIRIHRKHIINTKYLISMKNYKLTMRDGTELPVSQKNYSEIKKKLAAR